MMTRLSSRKIVLLCLLFVLLLGCNAELSQEGRPASSSANKGGAAEQVTNVAYLSDGGEIEEAVDESRVRSGRQTPEADAATTPSPRMVIYNAWMTLVVHRVDDALGRAQEVVSRHGGFVQSSSSRQVVLRIPAAHYSEALDDLKKLGEVRALRTSSQDVTEAFTDLTARIENLRVLQARYRALLAAATTTATRLAIERELRRISRSLQTLEEQRAYMADQIALATITLDVERKALNPRLSQRPAQPFDFVRGHGVASLIE